MRTRTGWLAVVLAAGMALAPGMARAQDIGGEVPRMDPPSPLPLNPHLERGGLFASVEFLLLKQSRNIKNQVVAARGLFDADGSLTGTPGQFVGSGRVALRADDLGPLSYAPGFNAVVGYRFRNGMEMQAEYWHMISVRYNGGASLAPPFFKGTGDLSDTFLSANVFNFSPEFGGPIPDVALGRNAGFGIWNAADQMDIQFEQRYDQIDFTSRVPIFQTENDRCYGLLGGRFAWIWERFLWRTIDLDLSGVASGEDVAIYTNIVSNRMYGPFIGLGNEWYMGHGFSVSLDLRAAILLDVVKERVRYERGDFATINKRSRTEFTVVPEVQGQLNLWWYPIEGVAVRVGYNAFGFFNTIGSERPIVFNFGGLDPPWEHQFLRLFDGVNAGISFIF